MPIKFTTTRRPGGVGVGVGCRGWKEERKEKKSKRNHRTSGNKRINVPLESLLSDSFPLPGSHSLPHLPRMPSNTVLVSGPAVGAAQILIWSTPVCSCLQCPQLPELVYFLLWELSVPFYIFHRHRVCLVDHVDLICNLYSWWEGFGSSSLATLALGFNCGFISTSACGSSTGDCS